MGAIMLLEDLKHTLRVLLKNPGFTAVAVVVLALGIGANSAIFSVVNAALLRPLPFSHATELVQIYHVPPAKSFPGMTRFAVSAANYLDWARQNHVFQKTAIYTYASFDLAIGDNPEVVPAGAVESSFFSVYGVQPMLGRGFLPQEDQAGHGNVVVLGYDLWRSHFGANPKIVGQRISLNSAAYTVVGVMGPTFRRPDWAKIWTPLAWTEKERAVRGEHHFLVIARLRRGVSLNRAQTEMDVISGRLQKDYPEDDNGWGAVVVPLRDDMVGDVRPALLILLGAVAFVLLIACANISNLVLARTMARRKEMAIRAALGASRGRIVQHVLAEAVTLSVLGGALGLAMAAYGADFLSKLLAGKLPQSIDIRLDGWVLAFTVVISILAGTLAGLLPAWRFSQINIENALRQGLGKTDSDSGGQRSLSALVVCEVALCFMLLIGAGLMIRSLASLYNVDPGLDAHNVITMTISVPPKKFAAPSQENAFFDRVIQRVRTLPGVEAASAIDSLPVSGGGSTQPVAIAGRPAQAMADQPEVAVRVVTPDYLRTMHIPLLRGRALSEADTEDSRRVVLISESMAARFWPGQDPIGRHLTLTFMPEFVREVAGVVGDVKQEGLDVAQPVATIYFPLAQLSGSAPGGWRSFPLSLVVRTRQAVASSREEVIRAVHQVDPNAPVLDVMTMDHLLADSLAQRRLNMQLLAAFAGLALVLAAIGLYSVLAYSVRRRVREIGVRMALGAQTVQVLRMVVMQGLKITGVGLALGIAAAFAISRVLASLLFGVGATDIVTYAAVSLLLVSVALLASVVPAYRATRVDPIRTLRDE
jgi:putative ABC transport system permease protein